MMPSGVPWLSTRTKPCWAYFEFSSPQRSEASWERVGPLRGTLTLPSYGPAAPPCKSLTREFLQRHPVSFSFLQERRFDLFQHCNELPDVIECPSLRFENEKLAANALIMFT
jgi:hypothetical protein